MCLFFLVASDAFSQNRFDALRFSTQYPSSDAANASLAGASVASYFGYGSVFSNPATLGMAKKSEVHLGLGYRDVSESSIYLGNRRAYDDSQTSFTNAGFVYSFPTVQGSLVIGGGYNQIADFNRSFRATAYNTRSSITDFFFDNDFYFDTAYRAYAIEEDDFGLFPVLRPDFGAPFAGINQTMNQVERGQLGEFTASIASEFAEGLYVGATLGIPVGTYSYKRDFIERDTEFVHGNINTEINGQPFTIPAVDNIVWRDRIDADITGFTARLGAVYKPVPQFSVGASFSFPTQYRIDENYSVFIQTNYENGQSESDELIGSTSYNIRIPARLAFGFSTHDLPVNVSASVERVGYSRVQFRNYGDLELEIRENELIRDDFKNVFNFKVGASMQVTDAVHPTIGYAYYPSASRSSDNALQMITGGMRIGVNQSFSIDFGLQYLFFDDDQVVYDFYNYNANDGSFLNETIRSSVERFHAVVGFNIRF